MEANLYILLFLTWLGISFSIGALLVLAALRRNARHNLVPSN